eukprot:scaffold28748_cov64-Phaeocystis_antarctica.AAC.11
MSATTPACEKNSNTSYSLASLAPCTRTAKTSTSLGGAVAFCCVGIGHSECMSPQFVFAGEDGVGAKRTSGRSVRPSGRPGSKHTYSAPATRK